MPGSRSSRSRRRRRSRPRSPLARATASSAFVCQSCATAFPRWEGRCRTCGAWNSLVETVVAGAVRAARARAGRGASPITVAPPSRSGRSAPTSPAGSRVGIAEVDRVLGGGLVSGELVLLGGEPGIGKSTLVLQLPRASPSAGGDGRDRPLRHRRRIGRAAPAARGRVSASTAGASRNDWRDRRHGRRVDRRGRAAHRPALLVVDFDPDRRRRGARRPARFGRAGTRGRRPSRPLRARSRTSRSCWSATSRRTARSPARARSSISSTRSSCSRATGTARCGSCER